MDIVGKRETKINIASQLTCGQQHSSVYIAHQRRPNAIKRSRNHAFGGVGEAGAVVHAGNSPRRPKKL